MNLFTILGFFFLSIHFKKRHKCLIINIYWIWYIEHVIIFIALILLFPLKEKSKFSQIPCHVDNILYTSGNFKVDLLRYITDVLEAWKKYELMILMSIVVLT